MTFKKAYITLSIVITITILVIVLFVSNVSSLDKSWGLTGFLVAFTLSVFSIIYGLFMLKKQSKSHHEKTLFKKIQFEILDWLSFIATSSMIIFSLFMFFIIPSEVSQASMTPTLSDKDRILLYHFNYEVQRNDIVVIRITKSRYPTVSQNSFCKDVVRTHFFTREKTLVEKCYDEIYFVKRIIALPGDYISFSNYDETQQTYEVFINGLLMESPNGLTYLVKEHNIQAMSYGFDDQGIVYQGLVFAFGDHTTGSEDSRSMGPIYIEDIKGKVIFRMFPNIGVIK